MMTDPIADFCTRIRNACRIERAVVDVPASGIKIGMAEALKQEGYIFEYQVGHFAKTEDGQEQFNPTDDSALPKRFIRVYLKYGQNGSGSSRRSAASARRAAGSTAATRSCAPSWTGWALRS